MSQKHALAQENRLGSPDRFSSCEGGVWAQDYNPLWEANLTDPYQAVMSENVLAEIKNMVRNLKIKFVTVSLLQHNTNLYLTYKELLET